MKWLDRSLIVSGYYFGLCTSKEDFQRELARLAVPRDNWPRFNKSPKHASVHYFEKGDGKQCAIVTIQPGRDKTGVQIAALLVHEAAHIWRAIREDMNEKEPSAEFEAYSLQAISQELMQAYSNSIKRRKRR